jgi:putative RecB family exonuclease
MPTFSHSSLSTFESCPLHYKLRYVQHLAPPDERESIELFMGKRVHETLAFLYEHANNPPAISELLAYYDGNWTNLWKQSVFIAKAGLTPSYFQDFGSKCISDYYSRNSPFTQEKTLVIETRITIPLGEFGEYKLAGVVDRFSLGSDGVYRIHDYKTSRSMPSPAQFESDRQLTLYQLGMRQQVGADKAMQLVWHYLAFNQDVAITRTEAKLAQVESNTIKLAITVQDATEQDAFPPHVGPLCEYCEYKPVCPAWTTEKTPKKTVQTRL